MSTNDFLILKSQKNGAPRPEPNLWQRYLFFFSPLKKQHEELSMNPKIKLDLTSKQDDLIKITCKLEQTKNNHISNSKMQE